MTLKDELPRTLGTQYATGEELRSNSRKNEEREPKGKQHIVVDVTGDGSPMLKRAIFHRKWNVGTRI